LTKQERYAYLAAMPEGAQTDEERTEQTQLYYELDPSNQWWNNEKPPDQQRAPKDILHVDTSMYTS
jgi:hypothetical protein